MSKSGLIWVLALVSIFPLAAEDIQLKDGTKVTGKLISIKGDTFEVKTAYGDINIPRSQVLTITFTDNLPKAAGDTPESLPAIDESLEGTLYKNKTASFQFSVPAGWKLAPALRQSKDIIAALASDDETLFVLVTPEKFSGTLATYKVLAETQYKSRLSDYQKLDDTAAKLDGREGSRLVFQGKSTANNASLKFLVYILPYDGRMVRLTLFTLEPLFTDNLPTLEKIAASYQSMSAVK